MSSLVNKKIKNTYDGLIKTADELPIDGTLKNLEDGNGGVLPIQVSTSTVNFTGTVTGIDPGGMVAGAAADSIKSADTLTTNAASAAGAQSIALGDGATTVNTDQIAIGKNAVANQMTGAIAIGANTVAAGAGQLAIGKNANAVNGMAIGPDTDGGVGRSLAVGISAQGTGNESCAIGGQANATGSNSTALGDGAGATANQSVAVGNRAEAIAIGAVALGYDVTASTQDTVSIKALETQTDSTPTAGGIIMSDAGGTDRRININASGALQIDSTPVGGGGGSAGLVSGTGTDSMQSASSLTTGAANASEANTIALGDSSVASSEDNIAIGKQAEAAGDNAFARRNIAIGYDSLANNEKDVAIGTQAQATGARSTAIGDNANGSGSRAVVIGASSSATAFSSCVFGAFSTATAEGATVVGGYGSSATAVDAIAVGKEADATAIGAIAIGKLAQATADGAVAIGSGINAVTADTVTMDKLQILDYANINYADDTAAAAGGIPLGGVYHNAGALKIRIV